MPHCPGVGRREHSALLGRRSDARLELRAVRTLLCGEHRCATGRRVRSRAACQPRDSVSHIALGAEGRVAHRGCEAQAPHSQGSAQRATRIMLRRLRGGGRGDGDDRTGGRGDDRDDGMHGGGCTGQMAPPPIAAPVIETGPPMDIDAALEGLAGKRVRALPACRSCVRGGI